jgi:Ankyrin repeats (3 copies)
MRNRVGSPSPRKYLATIPLLCHIASGAYEDTADRQDAFYHACEQSDTALLERLFEPGFESMINHKLDFEDVAGVRWFLERGADVNANHCLHHAVCRGRGITIITMLLDAGMHVDTRGWSNLTPLDQAAMHGRVPTVKLLIERDADLDDRAFDDQGPTPLDCAVWGVRNNRAEDGDYAGTVEALLAGGAPTRHSPPTGDAAVDALLSG